jgi:hypothetical protein
VQLWFREFTLATSIPRGARTCEQVWGRAGVCPVRGRLPKGRHSQIWRVCRMVQGLSVDYG